MADELQVTRLRAVGVSQGQTQPIVITSTGGLTTIPTNAFGTASVGVTIVFPNRGAILVIDSATGSVGNNGTAGASAGSLAQSNLNVNIGTGSGPLIRSWPSSSTSVGIQGQGGVAIQTILPDEIDSLEAQVLGVAFISQVQLTFFATINNTTAGSIGYNLTAMVKYHFRLQQQ